MSATAEVAVRPGTRSAAATMPSHFPGRRSRCVRVDIDHYLSGTGQEKTDDRPDPGGGAGCRDTSGRAPSLYIA
ncbi:hypothetical protein GCM10009584_03140 [Ornithinimicrobium humiphilum]